MKRFVLALSASFCVVTAVGADAIDKAASAALFTRMATVLQHPRCINCHPAGDFPRQGDDRHKHFFNVVRGDRDRGAAGLHCSTCHQSANQRASGIPGAADWQLAPLRMAWEGLSIGELCRAIRDPERGNMPPEKLLEHFRTSLVMWAFAPGTDAQGKRRTIPPMSHADFIALTKQWIESGAQCPN
jgi:hypothetical protein